MKDAKHFLQAYEYLFSLGCKIPRIADEILPPESMCYQSLRVAAFDPAYLISILQIENMAELALYVEIPCAQITEDANSKFRWLAAVTTALEKGSPLPSTAPPNFCVIQSHSMLTSSQLDWLHTEMERIQPLTLHTAGVDASLMWRDGESLSGGVKLSDQTAHSFYWRNGDAEDSMHKDYHRSLYRLAASAIKDPQCSQLLKNMTLNRMPSGAYPEGFAIPLIE